MAGSNNKARRTPVKIPASDNSALLAENRFTLIGRVTNPQTQHPRALVEYMLQYWNLDNRVTGRELGPERFYFRFQTEADLQLVLKRAPYHFKKWMFILQRWEPVVSDSFPALIPFWITIHDLPMHHCTSQTLQTIGQELGQFVDKNVAEGRIRVNINGLNPLEMAMPLELPTGEITTVQLEYERLEKHCFNCFSLQHEEKSCPKNAPLHAKEDRALGINQQRTLQSLEDTKRRQDSRSTGGEARREPPLRSRETAYKADYRSGSRHALPPPSSRKIFRAVRTGSALRSSGRAASSLPNGTTTKSRV